MDYRRRRSRTFPATWFLLLGAVALAAGSAAAADAKVGLGLAAPGQVSTFQVEGGLRGGSVEGGVQADGALRDVNLEAAFQGLLAPVGEALERTAAQLPRTDGAVAGTTATLVSSAEARVVAGAGAAAAATLLVLRPLWFLGLLAPLFSRMDRGDLLAHPVRREVVRLVAREPGMNTTDLHRHFDLGWGSLVYHLQRLEGQGLLVSHRWGRSRRYFLSRSGMEARGEGIRALKAATAHALATTISAQPGQTQEELSRSLGLTKSVVSKYAKRLEHANLVRREVGRNCLRLFPTAALRELLLTWSDPNPAGPDGGAEPIAPTDPSSARNGRVHDSLAAVPVRPLAAPPAV